jgi:hypothetical protein
MASQRQFGAELSSNVPAPLNLLKRRLPRFHYEDREDEPRAGKKARTLSDMNLHFQEHEYRVPPQKKRVQSNRSKKSKVEVLLFLEYHRVLKDKGLLSPPVRRSSLARNAYEERLKDEYVRPSQRQAALWFLIPQTTISDWWKNRDRIFNSQEGSRRVQKSWTCCWPEMEKELFRLFCERRTMGYIVRRWWFRTTSIRLFRETYGDPLRAQGKHDEAAEVENLFVFSNGYFEGFCRRNRVTLRKLTRVVSFWFQVH